MIKAIQLTEFSGVIGDVDTFLSRITGFSYHVTPHGQYFVVNGDVFLCVSQDIAGMLIAEEIKGDPLIYCLETDTLVVPGVGAATGGMCKFHIEEALTDAKVNYSKNSSKSLPKAYDPVFNKAYEG